MAMPLLTIWPIEISLAKGKKKKAKIDKLDLIKLKSFCTMKECAKSFCTMNKQGEKTVFRMRENNSQ